MLTRAGTGTVESSERESKFWFLKRNAYTNAAAILQAAVDLFTDLALTSHFETPLTTIDFYPNHSTSSLLLIWDVHRHREAVRTDLAVDAMHHYVALLVKTLFPPTP